jgi:8-amino-7-oxononanoate synthase
VLVGAARDGLALSSALRRHGVFCPAIRPPTVLEGRSRLRVVPMATHTDEQIERALAAFVAARAGPGETAG